MRRFSRGRKVLIGLLASALATTGLATSASGEPAGSAQPQQPARVQAAGDRFACTTSRFFLAQDPPGAPSLTQLGTLTPGSDDVTTIGGETDLYNAIGYNEVDDFIYAILNNGHLGRIDGEGNVTDLGTLTAGNNASFNAGAVEPGGRYYYVTTNASGFAFVYRIDLQDPDYTDGIDTLAIPLEAPNGNPRAPLTADITFVGDDMWGERSDADTFVRITLDDLTNPTLGTVDIWDSAGDGVEDAESGAAWTYANGNLGLSDNDTGTIYQVQIDNPTAGTPTFTLVGVSDGPSSAVNDGTSCAGGATDLAISKTVAPAPAAPGASLTYTLTVENLGPNDSSGFIVTDAAPGDLTNLQTTTPGCAFSGHALSCTGGALAHGASTQLVYTALAPAVQGVLVNNATVTGYEDDVDLTNNTASTRTIVATPFACPTGTVFLSQDVSDGQDLDMQLYTLTSGATTFTPVGTPNEELYNATGFNPNDGLIYGVRGDRHMVAIDSTGAVIDLGEVGAPQFNNNPPNVGAIDPATGIHYAMLGSGGTLFATNLGDLSQTAIPLAAGFPDLFDLSFIDGMLWGHANGSSEWVRVNPADGTWTAFGDSIIGSVQAGATWTYGNGNLGLLGNSTVYQVHIENPNTATPTFSLVSALPGLSTRANQDATACSGRPADLEITKAVAPSPAAPGAQLTWTLTVDNNGPGDSSGFVVKDTVPAAVTNLATSTPGCAFSGNSLTCQEGPLAVSDPPFVITYTGTAPAAAGTLVNVATVIGNDEDPQPVNDNGNANTLVAIPTPTPTVSPTPTPTPVRPSPGADLSMDKDGPAKVTAGKEITWRIKVRNRGPATSVGAVVTDTLPKKITSAKVSPPKGVKCSFSKRTLTCHLGKIASGKAVVIKVTGTVSKGATGTMRNVARVRADNDPNARNNADAVQTKVQRAPRPQTAPATQPRPTPKPSDLGGCGGSAGRGYAVSRPGGGC